MAHTLGTFDILAIAVYFVLLLAIYLFSLSKSDRSNTEGYFLAGREMNWFLVGMSLFSTNIGAEHFIGLAGSGSVNGISAAAFEIHAMFIMQLLSWVFVPTLVSAGVQTMPEYFSARLERRRIRVILAVVYLILYILTKVSVNIYAGALFVQVAFNWNIYYAILAVLAVAALFTIGGGLATVMYTDTFMSVLMLTGGTILCIMAFNQVGYMPGLYNAYMNAISNETIMLNRTDPSNPLVGCGTPKEIAFRMLRNIRDPYMPWLGLLLGQTSNTIWYWCSDQMMVQRVMASRSAAHARGGTLLTGFLKISPLFLMVFVGMISRSLYASSIDGLWTNYTNKAYPEIAMRILPEGLRGLHTAVMISALVSGLTSLFNSSSTLFTLDIYRLIRNKASNLELMIVGRLFATLIIALAVAWIPIVMKMQGTDIYTYIQSVNSFFAAPIASIYVVTTFWAGLSEAGAFYALMLGFTMGVIRMILEFSRPTPACGQLDRRFAVVKNFNFMYFSMLNFFVTGLAAIILSHFTARPNRRAIEGRTYQTRRTAWSIEKMESLTVDSFSLSNVQLQGSGSEETDEPALPSESRKESGVPVRLSECVDSVSNAKEFPKWLTKFVKFFCGLNIFVLENENASTKQSSRDPDNLLRIYKETVQKFNEPSISTFVKNLQRIVLTVLALTVLLCYIVLSLNPKLTFVYN